MDIPNAASKETIATSLADLAVGNTETACLAARKLKSISEADRAALYPWRKPLIREALRTSELRVRWNLMIVLGRLPLQGAERAAVIDWMFERLADESSLTRTFALQALMDLSESDPPLRVRVLPLVRDASESGTAAMRARARKLLRSASRNKQPR